jgi:bifunctional DNase/RNase
MFFKKKSQSVPLCAICFHVIVQDDGSVFCRAYDKPITEMPIESCDKWVHVLTWPKKVAHAIPLCFICVHSDRDNGRPVFCLAKKETINKMPVSHCADFVSVIHLCPICVNSDIENNLEFCSIRNQIVTERPVQSCENWIHISTRPVKPEVEMILESVKSRNSLLEFLKLTGNEAEAKKVWNQHVLILREKGGNRYLPIWVGPYEGNGIVAKLQGVTSVRPLTHDFILSIIDNVGASIKSVVINKIKDDCFYSLIRLDCIGQLIEVDCRPSDAVAVALRAGAPIFANEEVMNKAAVTDIQ